MPKNVIYLTTVGNIRLENVQYLAWTISNILVYRNGRLATKFGISWSRLIIKGERNQ